MRSGPTGPFGAPRSAVGVVGILVLALSAPRAADAEDNAARSASALFRQRCAGCHTVGKGVKVGPDLKGVAERRERSWIMSFVRSSQRAIASGDAVAVELYREFKQERMPDWAELGDAQIGAIVDWLAAGAPVDRPADERDAGAAAAVDVEIGRRLFAGTARFAGGGAACAGCHAAGDGGGSLGPDLGRLYAERDDRAITQLLKTPCFPRLPESATTPFLLPLEAFALKAYLRHLALPRGGEPR